MCVIIASNTEKVPVDWLDKAAKANRDGQGIAWVKDDKTIEVVKGVELKEIKKIYESIKPPYLLHFRLATQGGTSPKMCHPFPVGPKAELFTRYTAEAVLAHNGSNNKWKEDCKQAVLAHKVRWPSGPWSDSRAFAFLCGLYGFNFADLLDEKIAILTPKGVMIYGQYWQEEGKVHLSNRSFLYSYDNTRARWSEDDYNYDTDFYKTHRWDTETKSYVPKEQCCLPGTDNKRKKTCTNPHCEDGQVWTGNNWHACLVCGNAKPVITK